MDTLCSLQFGVRARIVNLPGPFFHRPIEFDDRIQISITKTDRIQKDRIQKIAFKTPNNR